MDYDVLVIGAGSGGLATAKAAAAHGAKVAISEPNQLGGTCVNRGCVPKKLMVQAAEFVAEQRAAKSYGWHDLHSRFDWSALRTGISQHIQDLNESQQQGLEAAGIERFTAAAKFADAHTVELGGENVTAEHIVIAVGSRPTRPDIPGIESALTSKDIFQLEALPQTLAIVGGGYIGVELGCILTQLGVQTTLIDTSSKVLSGFDDTLRTFVQDHLTELGIQVILEATCAAIETKGSGVTLKLSGQGQPLSTDAVLIAVGRSPNLAGLNLEGAGIQVSDGYVATKE